MYERMCLNMWVRVLEHVRVRVCVFVWLSKCVRVCVCVCVCLSKCVRKCVCVLEQVRARVSACVRVFELFVCWADQADKNVATFFDCPLRDNECRSHRIDGQNFVNRTSNLIGTKHFKTISWNCNKDVL